MNMKGSLPLLALHVLAEGPRHGYAIAQAIRTRSAGALDFGEGTLYPALHGLEARGLIESHVETVGGRSRRSYRISAAGLATLDRERAEWLTFSRAVAAVLGT